MWSKTERKRDESHYLRSMWVCGTNWIRLFSLKTIQRPTIHDCLFQKRDKGWPEEGEAYSFSIELTHNDRTNKGKFHEKIQFREPKSPCIVLSPYIELRQLQNVKNYTVIILITLKIFKNLINLITNDEGPITEWNNY